MAGRCTACDEAVVRHHSELVQQLSNRVLGALHLGQVRAGDRLPSIRQIARETGRNPRTVARAYAELEVAGLVEVRGNSGVFVASERAPGHRRLDETARWMSDVVVDAWRRRLPVGRLPELVHRSVAAERVRCALVDGVEDGAVAFRTELEEEWGFDVCVVSPDSIPANGGALRRQQLPPACQDAELVAATSFDRAAAQRLAAVLAKPFVALTVHPALRAAVKRRLGEGRLTIIAVDPRFAERIGTAYRISAADGERKLRMVLAHDRDAIRQLDPTEPVLLTRAAHRLLGKVSLPMVFPHSPTLSPESARALAAILVRRNLDPDKR